MRERRKDGGEESVVKTKRESERRRRWKRNGSLVGAAEITGELALWRWAFAEKRELTDPAE